jgi:hypothetical protein
VTHNFFSKKKTDMGPRSPEPRGIGTHASLDGYTCACIIAMIDMIKKIIRGI